MPIFVPILIGIVVVATTGYGGKKGYDGVASMRRAKAIGDEAERAHKRHVDLLDSARTHLVQRLSRTHDLRVGIARTTLGRMVELLQALDRRGKLRTPEDFTRAGVQPEHVSTFVAQFLEAGGTLTGAVKAAGAGAGASAAASSLIGTFATASTGAAMSGLSGAALQSAVLAWLGGGSLVAGGGGMALGGVVLGGIAVAPAVAIGGLVLSAQGEKAVTRAEEFRAHVEQAVHRIDALIAFHHRAERRAQELDRVLTRLDNRASAAIEDIFESLDDFDDNDDGDVERLRVAMLLCKALSDLLQTRVLDDDGHLDTASETLLAKYRYLTEDA